MHKSRRAVLGAGIFSFVLFFIYLSFLLLFFIISFSPTSLVYKLNFVTKSVPEGFIDLYEKFFAFPLEVIFPDADVSKLYPKGVFFLGKNESNIGGDYSYGAYGFVEEKNKTEGRDKFFALNYCSLNVVLGNNKNITLNLVFGKSKFVPLSGKQPFLGRNFLELVEGKDSTSFSEDWHPCNLKKGDFVFVVFNSESELGNKTNSNDLSFDSDYFLENLVYFPDFRKY